MEDKVFDAIVIGAGPGGTTIASLLANDGEKVLLIDKNHLPGGRMTTFKRDGFKYELFPINCVPMRNSLFEELATRLNKQDRVKPIYGDEFPKISMISYENKKGKVKTWDFTKSPFELLHTFGLKRWNLPALKKVGVFFKTLENMPLSEIEKLQTISAFDYVKKFGLHEGVSTYFLAAFAEGSFETTADKVTAAEMVRQFQTASKGGGGRFYECGIGGFFEVMAEAVEENGGKLLMNNRVEKINIENKRATGITTADGKTYQSKLIISSAGIRQTAIKLVGEEHFDSEYIAKLKKLENTLACVGYRFFTNVPVIDYIMKVYFPYGCIEPYHEFEKMAKGQKKPESNYIYIGTTSHYQGMAPKGKQCVYAVMSCAPDPKIDVKPYLDYITQRIKKIEPQIFEHIERTEIMSPATVPSVGNDSIMDGQGGEAYGIALTVGQTGENRPKAKSPVPGLYYVGNDVEGIGLGTHLAVDSGFKVYEMLKN
ncbi:MAG: NAD(P)/FAD-dependent oxidoreductase [Paludibacter sp.]|nr:NAD(P)/FAD-dependent oxidoreductase [Paludibacter sp.]